jgi:hypothetical protein
MHDEQTGSTPVTDLYFHHNQLLRHVCTMDHSQNWTLNDNSVATSVLVLPSWVKQVGTVLNSASTGTSDYYAY